jgi:hypothetical protein
MDLDYGKRAYIKVTELEKRLDDFINSLAKNTVKTLTFNLSTPEIKATYQRVFKFNALADGVVSLKITIPATSSNSFYELSHNGVEIKTGSTGGNALDIELSLDGYRGENEIFLTLRCGMPVSTSGLTATAVGTIDYISAKRKLSVASVSGVSYVAYLDSGYYTLYSYSDGVIKEIMRSKATDVCVLGCVLNELYIATIEEDKGLRITYYNLDSSVSLTTTPIANGVSSVCGYISDGAIKVIFVKTGEVFMGEYIKNEPFSYRSTYRRGSEVYADANSPNAYVIFDGFKPTKFVDFSATYVLQKGENYHISKINGGYNVTFSQNGKQYMQTIYDRVLKAESLGFFDEFVTLADGKTIKRVRENLTIGE